MHTWRIDKYCVARRVLIWEVSGRRVPSGPRLGWFGCCEGSLEQQSDDGGGCATMRGRYVGLESFGAYVDNGV